LVIIGNCEIVKVTEPPQLLRGKLKFFPQNQLTVQLSLRSQRSLRLISFLPFRGCKNLSFASLLNFKWPSPDGQADDVNLYGESLLLE